MATLCPTYELNGRCEGAILGIGAAAFAALRIDPGFKELMREGLVKVHSDVDACLPFVDTSPCVSWVGYLQQPECGLPAELKQLCRLRGGCG